MIAAKHPLIEHLHLSSPCGRITIDQNDDENPFEDFSNLTSLSLKLNLGWGSSCPDHSGFIDLKSVLDRLRLQSLKLSGFFNGDSGL